MLTTCTPTKHGYAMVLVMMYAQEKKKRRDANPISFARHWLKRVVWYLLDKWTWFQYRPPPAVGGGMVWTSKTCCPNTTIIGVEKQFPSHQKKWNQYNSYQSSCSLSLSHTQPFTEVLPHAHTTIYWSPSIITQPHQELAQCCLVTKRRKTLTLTTSNMNTQCWRSCTGLSFSSTPSDSTPSLHYRTWSKNCASLVARPLPRQLTFQNH